MEGKLKRYRNIISGYKVCYVKLSPEKNCLFLSWDAKKGRTNIEIGSKTEIIHLRDARVYIARGSSFTAVGNRKPQNSSDSDLN